MGGFSFRSFIFMLFITVLVWSSSFDTCIARRGKYLRHGRANSASLYKKKGKSHRSSHYNNHHKGSKTKPPLPPPPKKAPLPPSPKKAPLPSSPQKAPLPPSPEKAPLPPSPKKAPLPPSPEKAPLPPSPKKAPLPPSPEKAPLPPSSPKPPKEDRPRSPPQQGSATFNVLDFGAKGDGKIDDTKAFQAAWGSACKVEASMMLVPAGYVFLVGPVSFSGPYCKPNIVFQLDGTIIAPTNANAWGRGLLQWLEFTKLVGISIQGNGTIDGSGSIWWQDEPFSDPGDDETAFAVPLNSTVAEHPIRSELSQKMPSIKPTALRFYGSFNPIVTGIRIQNSPQCHLKFDNCIGVVVHDISISSPGDSPNTDGIHLQNSKDVLIHSSDLACGDDCVSIQTGCTNVYVHNVNCGPGHGISIGSLGRDNTKACVSNITVRDVTMHNTMTGVRIKTWQGGSGSVQGVLFSNIQVSEVQLPIVIDQYYCDKSSCRNQTSAVALSGINYERIRGTYTVKPVHFACSDALPCIDIRLTTIQLKPLQERYHLYSPFCWQTFGELNTPTVPPLDCLQVGKPLNNRPLSDHNLC